uniref:Tetratricopeptide repeat protein n=1 Tax=Desulfobacca acetoxidans TaxID=60893 RepID=A0A7V6A3Z9_9BACT
MLRPHRCTLLIFTLVIVMGWTGSAGAHHRGGLPLVHPDAPQPQALLEGATGPLSLKAEAYWQRLLAQEQAGDPAAAIKTGLALVNIFPQSREGAAALLKAGELAQKQGNTDDALELFGLVRFLTPGSPQASQACLAASALELARDVHRAGAMQSLRLFLERTSHLPPGYSPELFQEALKTGWLAVASQIEHTSPLPLSKVEEVLALWDLQPKGLGPPEAARLLAGLLQQHGLADEAQAVLAGATGKDRKNQQDMPTAGRLNQSLLLGGQAVLPQAKSPTPLRELAETISAPAWQLRWPAGFEPAGTAGDFLNRFQPCPPHTAWLQGYLPPLGKDLMPSWSPLLMDQPRYETARECASESSSPQEAPAPAAMAKQPGEPVQEPFSQYCLGVNCIQGGHPEEAQAIFQELAQNHDHFWQNLARVRLADLELSRLQAEPAP